LIYTKLILSLHLISYTLLISLSDCGSISETEHVTNVCHGSSRTWLLTAIFSRPI